MWVPDGTGPQVLVARATDSCRAGDQGASYATRNLSIQHLAAAERVGLLSARGWAGLEDRAAQFRLMDFEIKSEHKAQKCQGKNEEDGENGETGWVQNARFTR